MTNIKALQDLCHWELKEGSHEWPGPHGGTCINEAAIVVAGFDYKPVSDAKDLPPCFSRVLGQMLIELNDKANDDSRQKLIKFVTRLSGSADRIAVEKDRLNAMVVAAFDKYYAPLIKDEVRRLLPFASDKNEVKELASILKGCETASCCRDIDAIIEACRELNVLDQIDQDFDYIRWAALRIAGANPWEPAANLVEAIMNVFDGCTAEDAAVDAVIEILEIGFAIGKQADPLDAALIMERVAKAKASTPELAPEKETA